MFLTFGFPEVRGGYPLSKLWVPRRFAEILQGSGEPFSELWRTSANLGEPKGSQANLLSNPEEPRGTQRTLRTSWNPGDPFNEPVECLRTV